MTWTSPLWSNLKVTGGVTDDANAQRLLRLVGEPILEPPWVDVGDAAIYFRSEDGEQ